MDTEEAKIIALKALTFLAADTELMDRFAALSGVAPNDIVERAGDGEMLAGVLDFLLLDEAVLTDFCAAIAIDLEHPAAAPPTFPRRAPPHPTSLSKPS